MIPQILVAPKRVERRRVEAREEHIHDDEQIQFAILHARRNVFVIIREVAVIGAVGDVEKLVVVLNRGFEEVELFGAEFGGAFVILVVDPVVRDLVEGSERGVAVLVLRRAEDDPDLELLPEPIAELLLEGLVVSYRGVNVAHGEERVEPMEVFRLVFGVFLAFEVFRGHARRAEGVRRGIAHRLAVEGLEDMFDGAVDVEGGAGLGVVGGEIELLELPLHIGGDVVKIDVELEDVAVADRVDDIINVEALPEGLLGGDGERVFPSVFSRLIHGGQGRGVFREDRGSGESVEESFFEVGVDRVAHESELRSVTFVENEDELLSGGDGVLGGGFAE